MTRPLPLLAVLLLLGPAAAGQTAPDQVFRFSDRALDEDDVGDLQHGSTIAVDGDVAVVGSPYFFENGLAYVFERTAEDVWEPVARLDPDPPEQDGQFGIALAVDGHRIAVGMDAVWGGYATVLIFDRVDGVWTQTGQAASSQVYPDEGHRELARGFGSAIALAGDRLLVGVPDGREPGESWGSARGEALVFDRIGETWMPTGRLAGAETLPSRNLGEHVVLDGDRAWLLGATFEDADGDGQPDTGTSSTGLLTAFERVDGTWTLVDTLQIGAYGAGSFRYVDHDADGGRLTVTQGETVQVLARDATAPSGWARLPRLALADFGIERSALTNTALHGDRLALALPVVGQVILLELLAEAWQQTAVVPLPSATFWQGYSGLALTGDGLFVGDAYHYVNTRKHYYGVESGIVYHYRLEGGAWSLASTMQASAPDAFGASLAIDGNRALIGAPLADTDSVRMAGVAYVVERTAGGTWERIATLSHGAAWPGEGFGESVALDGTRAAIMGREVLYLFERAASGVWEEAARIDSTVLPVEGWGEAFEMDSASQPRPTVLALAGDRLLLGHPDGTPPSSPEGSGAAYVLDLVDGAWTWTHTLTAPAPTADGGFGHAVALDGDRALVSKPGEAFVFDFAEEAWTLTRRVAGSLRFGAALALDGDRALVGDPLWQNGSAHLFELRNGVWEQVARLAPSDQPEEDLRGFGSVVALDGDRALVDTGTRLYLFGQDGGAWREQTRLVRDLGDHNYYAGGTGALSGPHLLWASATPYGAFGTSEVYAYTLGAPVNAEDAWPTVFALSRVYPNPVAATDATLTLDLPQAAEVRAEVVDVLGRRVALVRDGPLAAGTHRLAVPTARLAAGAYVLRLTAGERVEARRFTVVR